MSFYGRRAGEVYMNCAGMVVYITHGMTQGSFLDPLCTKPLYLQ